MIRLALRRQEYASKPRTFSDTIKSGVNEIPKQFYGEFTRSPAAKSVGKQFLADLEISGHEATINSDVRDIYRTIRSRSQNQIIKKLQHMQDSGQSSSISDILLESITRSITPYDIFRRPPNMNTHKLYRQRMGYIRKWFISQRRTPPLAIWFLMLEEARIDKEQNPGSQLAVQTWLFMLEANVEPDVHCYNTYMAATCVQPAMYDRAKLRRRGVQPDATKRRDFNTAKARITVQNAVKLYRQMLNQGITPNSMTIELLILSLGWESNIDALKSLLLQTWNIVVPSPNFDALQDQSVADEYEEEGIDLDDQIQGCPNTARYAKHSPLYPSEQTMLAIAMAYGANSQCQLGTKVVQAFAHIYDLTITTRVWTELMKWAAADSEHLKGFTPRTYAEQLLHLAEDRYSTRPSIAMFAVLATHVSAGDRNPALAYQYADRMLGSVEGNLTVGRPKFQASTNYQYARHVFTNLYRRITKKLGSTIHQLQNKRARASGGVDEIRLLDEDIQRRKEHLKDVTNVWQGRLHTFDNNMRNMIISQRSKLASQAGEARSDTP